MTPCFVCFLSSSLISTHPQQYIFSPVCSCTAKCSGERVRQQTGPLGEGIRRYRLHSGTRHKVGLHRWAEGGGAHGGHGAIPGGGPIQLLQARTLLEAHGLAISDGVARRLLPPGWSSQQPNVHIAMHAYACCRPYRYGLSCLSRRGGC